MAKVRKKLKKYGFSVKDILNGLVVMFIGSVIGNIADGINSAPNWFDVVRIVFSVVTAVLAIIVLLYLKSFIQETRDNFEALDENFVALEKEFDTLVEAHNELEKDHESVKNNTQINSFVQVLQIVKDLFKSS